MKVKILKMVLPAFVLMLAVFSAFAFKSTEDKALLAPEIGWLNLPGQPCSLQVQCVTDPGTVCTAIYDGTLHQAFGKINPQSAVCNKILYRPQ